MGTTGAPMLTLRKAAERHHDRRRTREAWVTFPSRDRADPLCGGFSGLELLDEDRLRSGAGTQRRVDQDTEIITYVREGALAYGDSSGRSGIIHAGEFQRMTAGRGLSLRLASASRAGCAHVFRLSLRQLGGGVRPGREQKRFSAAERRGGLCVVASPDGRRGSLQIRPDALVFSALLDAGQHVVHELLRGRSAWLHLVDGEVIVGDQVLGAGDGAGVAGATDGPPALSFTARRATEILLVDLGTP